MPDETNQKPRAVEEERKMREHEREARERDPEERDTAADSGLDPEGATQVPPANAQRGSLSQ
jgi:hypothetical protein